MQAAADQSQPPAGPGFGVYLHWPFCLQKCPYCDFNSHVRHGGVDADRFVTAFLREIDATARLIGPRDVRSIFIGGGTPSLMPARSVGQLLDGVARAWRLAPGAEITIEANPSSVEAERFRAYRAAGINRVSLGIQSLRDSALKALGRLHTVAEAIAALHIAQAAFERTSFDLIYARPGQTEADWQQELSEALALAGEHISLYQLTIEPDTPFAKLHALGKLAVPEPEPALALYRLTSDMTAAAGLGAYEISNHARPGAESRHNMLYWRYGEYAGIGPGAHGRLIIDGARYATSAERQPELWAERVEAGASGVTETAVLSRSEQADEMLLMGLRLEEGLDLARLAAIGGVRPDPLVLRQLAADGLIEIAGAGLGDGALPASIRAVGQGRFVLNTLVSEISLAFRPAGETARGYSQSHSFDRALR